MKILMNAALKSKVTPDNKVQKNEERVRNKEITWFNWLVTDESKLATTQYNVSLVGIQKRETNK